MILIRFFDTREVDNAKVCNEVKRFLDAIAVLFLEARDALRLSYNKPSRCPIVCGN